DGRSPEADRLHLGHRGDRVESPHRDGAWGLRSSCGGGQRREAQPLSRRPDERPRVEPIFPVRRFIGAMRLAALVAALLLLTACGDPQSGALAGGRDSASPPSATTPTPDIALRLMDRVRNMTALVRRVDRIAAAQEKWGDILTRSGSQIPGVNPGEDAWLVAVVGEVAPSFGRGGPEAYDCATFVFDGQENVKSSAYSALSGCARYFTDSLVPALAPVT